VVSMSENGGRRMAFPVPPDLDARAAAVIEKVRVDSMPRAHARELAELIADLTHAGLAAYFLAPLERVGVGALTYSSAKVTVGAAEAGLPALTRRVIGKMTDEQLREIAEIIDEMLGSKGTREVL
jgi:hypothetical protein